MHNVIVCWPNNVISPCMWRFQLCPQFGLQPQRAKFSQQEIWPYVGSNWLSCLVDCLMKDRSSPHPINNSEDYQFIYLVEGFLMSALYHSFCHWWYQQKSWRKEGLGTRLVNAYIKDMVLAFEAALSQAPPSFPSLAVRKRVWERGYFWSMILNWKGLVPRLENKVWEWGSAKLQLWPPIGLYIYTTKSA